MFVFPWLHSEVGGRDRNVSTSGFESGFESIGKALEAFYWFLVFLQVVDSMSF